MVDYGLSYTPPITGGNFDNTTGTLSMTDNLHWNTVAKVNILDKSVSRTIPFSGSTFWLKYQGAK